MARDILFMLSLKKEVPISAHQDPSRITGPVYTPKHNCNALPVLPLTQAAKNWNGSNAYVGHPGIDSAVPTGTPVFAIWDGSVWAGPTGGTQGIYFNNTNSTGVAHTCAHLSKIVKTGRVKKGELLGYSGESGYTVDPKTGVRRKVGAHLHEHFYHKDFGILDAFAYATGKWTSLQRQWIDTTRPKEEEGYYPMKKLDAYNLNNNKAIMVTAGAYVLEDTAKEVLAQMKLLYPNAGIQFKEGSAYGKHLVVVGRHVGTLKEAQAIASDIRKATGNNNVEAWAW